MKEKWEHSLGGDDIVKSFQGSRRCLMYMFSNIRETSRRNQLPFLENADAVRDGFRYGERMCNEEYRATPFGEFGENMFGDNRAFRIKSYNGFVDQEEFWFMEECCEDAKFLLVPSGISVKIICLTTINFEEWKEFGYFLCTLHFIDTVERSHEMQKFFTGHARPSGRFIGNISDE